MPTILDKPLYDAVSKEAKIVYQKPSAYRSMWIQKTYKERGGRFRDDGKPKTLKRWMYERWEDVGKKDYPVFRPTVRVNKSTPLLVSEISPSNLKKQIARKQIIMGEQNLEPFIKKTK